MIYKSRALNFTFRKLEFDAINSNESPFKYYISILRGVGGPEFGKTCLRLARSINLKALLFELEQVGLREGIKIASNDQRLQTPEPS